LQIKPMPTNRITMRRIRETLRLHLQAGLSYNEVGRALKISKSVVGKYVSLARVAGVDWAVAQTLTDDELEARLYLTLPLNPVALSALVTRPC
jgi:DNA-binding transcriptional regulator LsrR (DeoR family)